MVADMVAVKKKDTFFLSAIMSATFFTNMSATMCTSMSAAVSATMSATTMSY